MPISEPAHYLQGIIENCSNQEYDDDVEYKFNSSKAAESRLEFPDRRIPSVRTVSVSTSR